MYGDGQAPDAFGRFRKLLDSYVTAESTVLDIGAGAGRMNAYQLRGRCKKVVGVDADPRVKTNPLLDRGVVGDVMRTPFPNDAFDVAFAVYVLEHLGDPAGFVAEVNRVLKPGGYFLAITPNRYHYVAVVSVLTPQRFHRWFRKKHYGAESDDTFPTYYRMNSRAALGKYLTAGGFEIVSLQCVEAVPSYLTFSVPTFLLGALYERIVNASEHLAGLRVNILCAFRKPVICPDQVRPEAGKAARSTTAASSGHDRSAGHGGPPEGRP